MSNVGALYDANAKDRMQDYANQQSQFFMNEQNISKKKEWLYISLAVAFTASIILVSIKSLNKKNN